MGADDKNVQEHILESKYKSVPIQTLTNEISVSDYLLKKAAENVENGKHNWMVKYELYTYLIEHK